MQRRRPIPCARRRGSGAACRRSRLTATQSDSAGRRRVVIEDEPRAALGDIGDLARALRSRFVDENLRAVMEASTRILAHFLAPACRTNANHRNPSQPIPTKQIKKICINGA
jgi:hypothetical protein